MRFQISDFRFKILVILGIIFFFIYSFLIFGNSAPKFTWPDETANYFFINNYIEHHNFSIPEPLNEQAGNIMKPRSFNVYQGNLVPGSFLGLLLIYGLIGKIVGLGLLKFLTPLLGVVAGLFFYKILLRIFEPRIAFLSALLFFINPAWWYYASFSMLPNIPFLTFLLIGLYFILRWDKNEKQRNWLLVVSGAFFIALAIMIRTNEIIWIFGALLFLLLIYQQKVKWQYVLLFLFVCLAVFSPIFYYNNLTFGSPLSFGYLRLANDTGLAGQLPSEFATNGSPALNLIKVLVLPFGFHPRLIFVNFFNYIFLLFWHLVGLAVIGGFLFIKNYQQKKHGVYFLLSFFICLYLLAYYGSWVLADQMTLQLNKIGLSYVRYFLPIYILILPLVAVFINYFLTGLTVKKFKILVGIFLFLAIMFVSLNMVYLAGNDGLLQIKENIRAYNLINKQVVDLTPVDAIIISQRSDKIFFPGRKVISSYDFNYLQFLPELLNAGKPLYYYAFEGQSFMTDLTERLKQLDLELKNEKVIWGTEKLYQIDFIKNES